MMLVDTHSHLNFEPLLSDLEKVLQRARQRGVTRVVVPAYDLESWCDIERLLTHGGLFGALGLHPWVAEEPLDDDALVKRALEMESESVRVSTEAG